MADDLEIFGELVTKLATNERAKAALKDIVNQLKTATNDADSLTVAEIEIVQNKAKQTLDTAKQYGFINDTQHKEGQGLVQNLSKLTGRPKEKITEFLNGFDELLEAKNKEDAKKAAEKAQAAAPDFFTAIISLFLGLLGFSQEQIDQFTGAMSPKAEEPAPAAAETAPPAATTSAPAADASAPSTPRTSPTLIDEVGRARAPLPNTPEARALVQTARYIYEESKYRSDLLAETPKRSLDEITTKSQSTQSTQTREDYYAAAFKADALQKASGTSWNGLPGAGGGLGVAAIGVGAGYGTAAGVTALMGGVSTTATTGVAATLATAGVSLTGTGVGAVVGVPLIVAGGVIGVSSAITARSNAVDGAAIIDYNGIENDLYNAERALNNAEEALNTDPAYAYMGLKPKLVDVDINETKVKGITFTLDDNSQMGKDARAIGIKGAETEFLKALEDGVMPKYDKAALAQKKEDLDLDGKKAALQKIAVEKEALMAQLGQAKALEELNDKLVTNPHLGRSTAGFLKATLTFGTEITDASDASIKGTARKNVEDAQAEQEKIKAKLKDIDARQAEAVKELAEAYRDEGKLNKQIEFAEDRGLAAEVRLKHAEITQIEINAECKRIDAEKKAKEEAERKAKEEAEAKALKEIATQAAAAGISNAPAAGAVHHSGGTGAPYPLDHNSSKKSVEARVAAIRDELKQLSTEITSVSYAGSRSSEERRDAGLAGGAPGTRAWREALREYDAAHHSKKAEFRKNQDELIARHSQLEQVLAEIRSTPEGRAADDNYTLTIARDNNAKLIRGHGLQADRDRLEGSVDRAQQGIARNKQVIVKAERIHELEEKIESAQTVIEKLQGNLTKITDAKETLEQSLKDMGKAVDVALGETDKLKLAEAARDAMFSLRVQQAEAAGLGATQTANAFGTAVTAIENALKDEKGISDLEIPGIRAALRRLDQNLVEQDIAQTNKNIQENEKAEKEAATKLYAELGVRSKAAPKDDEKQEKKPMPTPDFKDKKEILAGKKTDRSTSV